MSRSWYGTRRSAGVRQGCAGEHLFPERRRWALRLAETGVTVTPVNSFVEALSD